MILDDIAKYLPRKIDREKHRRLYINKEYIDRDKLKRIEDLVIKAFRKTIIEILISKGYVIQKEFMKNPENLGPDPDMLWFIIYGDNDIGVVIADSLFHTLNENDVNNYVNQFSKNIKLAGFEPIFCEFTSLESHSREYLMKRVFYAKLKYLK